MCGKFFLVLCMVISFFQPDMPLCEKLDMHLNAAFEEISLFEVDHHSSETSKVTNQFIKFDRVLSYSFRF